MTLRHPKAKAFDDQSRDRKGATVRQCGKKACRSLMVAARMFFLLASGFWLLASPGCGYSTKPLYNSSVKTVAVQFNNKTFRREWEFRLAEAVDKNIEARTPYKIAYAKNADTLLSGEIVDIQEGVLTRRFGTILPRETEITVVVNFTWKDLRSGRVLVERKQFNRSSTEIPQIGERVDDAEQWAIERLASAIVDQMRKDW
ncbi:MAG: LPS assembly lipoprotein LptE [Phycisphaerales bacterium]|nr:LPS assembly lipoprotein LptE [Phycisphaerales bacterium]